MLSAAGAASSIASVGEIAVRGNTEYSVGECQNTGCRSCCGAGVATRIFNSVTWQVQVACYSSVRSFTR